VTRAAWRTCALFSIAFELYYLANNQQYNADCSVMAAGHLPAGLPQDPQGTNYPFLNCIDTASYCVCAGLENSGNGNSSTSSCTFAGTPKDFFCLRQQQ